MDILEAVEQKDACLPENQSILCNGLQQRLDKRAVVVSPLVLIFYQSHGDVRVRMCWTNSEDIWENRPCLYFR